MCEEIIKRKPKGRMWLARKGWGEDILSSYLLMKNISPFVITLRVYAWTVLCHNNCFGKKKRTLNLEAYHEVIAWPQVLNGKSWKRKNKNKRNEIQGLIL